MTVEAVCLAGTKKLTLAGCRAAMDAAIAEATERRLRVTIAILDAGGHLLHLSRMDGVHVGSSEVAVAKARSAVLHNKPTRIFSELYAGGLTGLPALPGVLPFEGGLPIVVDGDVIGSIGVSGATPDVDGAIAAMGVMAVTAAA